MTKSKTTTSSHETEAALHLELVKELQPLAVSDGSLSAALKLRLADVLETLGIPGEPVVKLDLLEEEILPGDRFMRVRANGRPCRYPDELLRGVHSYVTGQLPHPGVTTASILAWLLDLLASGSHDQAVEFLSIACIEIVKRQPAVLLTMERANACVDSLREFETGADTTASVMPDPSVLLPILNRPLSLKISIADRQKVAQTLRSGFQAGRNSDYIAEDLIAALVPMRLSIQFPPDHLRQITTTWQEKGPEAFTFLRDGLLVESGLTYPQFNFASRDDLKPGSFTFQINHLDTLPFISLRPDQCLVNDTVERLSGLGIEGQSTINPANGQPGSIIDIGSQMTAENAGLTCWDQMGYMILCFAEVLRRNGACFVHRHMTRERLDQLDQAFPSLVTYTRAHSSDEYITLLLRRLASEEIPIRNLRLILETLLDSAQAANGGDSLSAVRIGMRQQIGAKYSRGVSTIVVYLLDPKIERLICGRAGENGEYSESRLAEDDAIIGAIRTEIEILYKMAPTATTPSLLTTTEVRGELRNIIALEFPKLAVISYAELPAGMNIQPIARILL